MGLENLKIGLIVATILSSLSLSFVIYFLERITRAVEYMAYNDDQDEEDERF